MKRLITALGLSVAALSASAVEFGKPFEQLDLDRALPNIEFAPVEPYVADSRAPFEQLTLDRAVPNLNLPSRNVQFAESSVGGTRTDASADTEASEGTGAQTESPWANDWNFIAPAL
jgi:hypothetical protein